MRSMVRRTECVVSGRHGPQRSEDTRRGPALAPAIDQIREVRSAVTLDPTSSVSVLSRSGGTSRLSVAGVRASIGLIGAARTHR
jgi:hypothetical protein